MHFLFSYHSTTFLSLFHRPLDYTNPNVKQGSSYQVATLCLYAFSMCRNFYSYNAAYQTYQRGKVLHLQYKTFQVSKPIRNKSQLTYTFSNSSFTNLVDPILIRNVFQCVWLTLNSSPKHLSDLILVRNISQSILSLSTAFSHISQALK